MFAYGSNMLSERLQQRCPSATTRGVAELKGYELRWHKKSTDGSGKCDIVETDQDDAVVLGVLYEVAATEKDALDRAEGLGHGYDEMTVTVVCDGELHEALAYYATSIDAALQPYDWYRALVLTGAREHRLPEWYLEQLAAQDHIPDPDDVRAERNWATIRDAGDTGS